MARTTRSTIPPGIELERADRILSWALDTFGSHVAIVTSFAAEGVAIIDMAARLGRPLRIATLDTGRLMPETYAVMDAVRERYGVQIDVVFPGTGAVEAMVREHGVNLFYRSIDGRRQCCAVRKVEPLARALAGLDAWITGLRRGQTETRTDVAKVEVDDAHEGIVKVSPLADWTWAQVWSYIRTHDVPYNALHDLGYPSIGCAPCTRAVQPGEDPRAGRWWWEQDAPKECGLHAPRRRDAAAPVEGPRPQ